MKKYWIIVDGQPQGPFSAEELKVRSDFSAKLPVWTSGMSEWSTVDQVSELAWFLTRTVEPETTAEETAASGPQINSQTQAQPGQMPDMRLNISVSQPDNQPVRTYLWWNVALAILMFWPTGLVGVFFSYRTARAMRMGDEQSARRASNAAAWCLLLTFTIGCVSMPFSLVNSFNTLTSVL